MDAKILSAVIADSQATQSIHRDMIQRMADWEGRDQGILTRDEDLRNAFVASLEGLRSAFTDRTLGMVDVSFPMMLDRTDPAHAIILAVRDDISDTRDRLQARRTQELLAKQVADAAITLPERLAIQTADAAKSLMDKGGDALAAGGKGLQETIKNLAWIVGGGFGIYLLHQVMGGRK